MTPAGQPSPNGASPLLAEKVIVVTGGAGLLGRAFVRAIAASGATAILADVDVARAEAAATEMTGLAGRVIPMPLDITKPESVDGLLAAVVASHGAVDGLVNNAYPRNRAYGRPVEQVTYADFCENMNLHVGGYFLVMQRFAAHFARQGGGSIVNMGSVYGTLPPRFEVYDGTAMTMPVEYAAIKAAILQLTRYFAQYYKKQGVRVNAVSPGGILDGQAASFVERYGAFAGSKGMLAPQDVSGALVFLLSDAARFVTGQNLIVDDGFSL